jgi:K+-transporting ATPase ATPase C chain
MIKELKQGLLFTVVSMLLVGGAYHVALWGFGRLVFPSQAEGSLIRRPDGSIAGARLIAQKFESVRYFHPRPSGVDYNAASTGGTNYGPSNPDHLTAVKERIDAVTQLEGVPAGRIPSEMVTASGGGLDPHIPPAAADLQAARVAGARGISVDRVRALIEAHVEPPSLGFLGRARVNVLELNLALDELAGAETPASAR